MSLLQEPFEFGIYRESRAGGYSHRDCTVAFYTRIGALIDSNTVMLNLGAGRGSNITRDLSPFRRKVQMFKGRVARVIGTDIDAAVAENPDLDEWHLVPLGEPLPVPDASIDIIVSDNVLEHVTDPAGFAAESLRVLKPGGWLCARTPTKWGYIGLGARLIPNALHTRLLRRLQPTRKAEDVFPTAYLMNTDGALRRAFPDSDWSHHSYGYNGVPGYHGNSLLAFRLIEFWCWLMPRRLSAKYHIFLQKRS